MFLKLREFFFGPGVGSPAGGEVGGEFLEFVAGIGKLLVSDSVVLVEFFSDVVVLTDLLVQPCKSLLGIPGFTGEFFKARLCEALLPDKPQICEALLPGCSGNFFLKLYKLCRCLAILPLCSGELFFGLDMGSLTCCDVGGELLEFVAGIRKLLFCDSIFLTELVSGGVALLDLLV